MTDSEDYLRIPVACYEEVESSSADSSVQSSVMLGDMLSIPLKLPFTPSLTPDSPLHGQPRLFAEDDYVLPPALPYEAPFTSARSDCPKSISSTDLVAPIPLSPSALASPDDVSDDILSSIADLVTKRLYYSPVASLVFSCRANELVDEFGFPVPEIEVELKGVSDVSSLRGELSWGGGPRNCPRG